MEFSIGTFDVAAGSQPRIECPTECSTECSVECSVECSMECSIGTLEAAQQAAGPSDAAVAGDAVVMRLQKVVEHLSDVGKRHRRSSPKTLPTSASSCRSHFSFFSMPRRTPTASAEDLCLVPKVA